MLDTRHLLCRDGPIVEILCRKTIVGLAFFGAVRLQCVCIDRLYAAQAGDLPFARLLGRIVSPNRCPYFYVGCHAGHRCGIYLPTSC